MQACFVGKKKYTRHEIFVFLRFLPVECRSSGEAGLLKLNEFEGAIKRMCKTFGTLFFFVASKPQSYRFKAY